MSTETSPELLAQFTAWVERQGINQTCESCGQHNWLVQPISHLDLFASDNVLSVVPLICKQCGYIRFYSAKAIGVA